MFLKKLVIQIYPIADDNDAKLNLRIEKTNAVWRYIPTAFCVMIDIIETEKGMKLKSLK